MEISYQKYILKFKTPATTSRGVLSEKETWFVQVKKEDKIYTGECGLLKGLSTDRLGDYENKLSWACKNFYKVDIQKNLIDFPSIRFGIEQLKYSLKYDNPWILFPSKFTDSKEGILINGLIWMGDANTMKRQIREKLDLGFSCLKLKIGSLDFEKEIDIIKQIRREYLKEDLELKLDANGAFHYNNALEKIEQLSGFNIHSIEQPIAPGQKHKMAELCSQSDVPIALDEELIGVNDLTDKKELLAIIKPQYIILKPSLIGGFSAAEEWIEIAAQHSIGWWATSALESNIGLNAISQWVFLKRNTATQGLGTGEVYTNNLPSPIKLKGDRLFYER